MSERFTLLSELGRGGMGVVWKARDEETGGIVALKLMRDIYAEDPDYLARFERELELAHRIDSPHVVKVLGYGVRERLPYLAFEYVDGPSLHEYNVRHGQCGWAEASAWLRQIAMGLGAAHAAGIVHRDVKPSNILIDQAGTAKLTDFGVARGLGMTRVTATSTVLGTPAYLAPEGPKDLRSDLYSLGIVGYELLTGEVPFKGTTYQEVIVEHIRSQPDLDRLPAEARPVLAWLLAKEPGQRPQASAELVAVLEGRLLLPSGIAMAIPLPAPAVATRHPRVPERAPVPQSVPSADPEWPRQPVGRPLPVLRPVPKFTSHAGPSMSNGRVWHTATLLRDGCVLFVGGRTWEDETLTSIELYAPHANRIESLRPLREARADHSAVRLEDGSVLIVGGTSARGAPMGAISICEPGRDRVDDDGALVTARTQSTAVLMQTGEVLIAGGRARDRALSSIEMYDVSVGTSRKVADLLDARYGHTCCQLSTGLVLFVGGNGTRGWLGSAESYDPVSSGSTIAWELDEPRSGHTATILSGDRLLVAGGENGGPMTSVELRSALIGREWRTSQLRVAREGHTASLLPDGRVLILGGANDTGALSVAELYDPVSGEFSDCGRLDSARVDHSATLLDDHRVLVAGGLGEDGSPLASTELFEINT